ncbi:bifunctional phosphoribosylaminoimidazolecarboxamide formyltransferase/IMP cyclohydrolase [Flavobacteriaceae bacterium]|nr:bifunctional phosphoribosylaminoimidazolecarboxamide formyltransferase/IMP cyclohydrolase [Flavobacteriaceae bacterium]MDB4133957.1 bifunctional phosphoribosylaminoimidazolecarboxamide formyltransferase/IMP cyclohydrolase [Flavobacteriaceae bacterium]MDB4179675.1 bifunctional phosphoribosylaminoimidazolecarboxamide formyltransferase/IMP cyclohydrolase [Flavobacteriaceae bacterium]MDC0622760.1 bifunctional phosphoribosylaminoimidazolecarboxamide formyltransferase/IMP cyclohydrolase [Flavobacte
MKEIKIKSALISVFNKDGLEPLIKELDSQGVIIYSTGGTQKFINDIGVKVIRVEDLTSYPSILGGRVKTLHPKVFGGILNRQDNESDKKELIDFEIPQIDLVIVDLYPFEDTIISGASHSDIIEKIDIGGISLIRAAAKNYNDVTCISSKDDYKVFLNILKDKKGILSNSERKLFALKSFNVSSNYDTAIFNYFNSENEVTALKISDTNAKTLRYGENPHQKGFFYGEFDKVFDKINGKELSYNNLLDVDAAVNLILEFKEEKPTFAILKHNNACGIATRDTIKQAYIDALAADPVSAFGGVLISNSEIDIDVAELINNLFCEVVIAPKFSKESLDILKQKKNRIVLVLKEFNEPEFIVRSCLNGYLSQQKDKHTDSLIDFKFATETKPSDKQIEDLLFASKICKNTKSNTIVLVKNKQLLASGTGQTSRVDALNQAIHKAKSFKFNLNEAAMASDAFFPFPDCVEIANNNGINSVIQPGGSIKDNLSIEYCNENKIPMVFTGFRHFKH